MEDWAKFIRFWGASRLNRIGIVSLSDKHRLEMTRQEYSASVLLVPVVKFVLNWCNVILI